MEQMEQLEQQTKASGFGFRGWCLMVYAFVAMLAFMVFTNFPMNLLADFYGGRQFVTNLYSFTNLAMIAVRVLIARPLAKVKNMKRLSVIIGIIGLLFVCGVVFLPPTGQPNLLWSICYVGVTAFVPIWGTFFIGFVIGQWFPRKKGVVMGITTWAFPIGNLCLAPFAKAVFRNMATTHQPAVISSFMPFMIITVIGILIGIFLVTDFPEQCGCYRDNDPSMTKEKAEAMMLQDQENKKNSVWTVVNCLKCPSFWFFAFANMCLVGVSTAMMTQTSAVIGSIGFEANSNGFTIIMTGIALIAVFGSWILGVLDTKFGTRKSMLIASICMLLSGILGAIGNPICIYIAFALLGIYMGAGSNYAVSGIFQYWRAQDYARVSAASSLISGIIGALLPSIIIFAVTTSGSSIGAFLVELIAGVIAVVCLILFKASQVKKFDDKFRAAKGLPMDDALVGRL